MNAVSGPVYDSSALDFGGIVAKAFERLVMVISLEEAKKKGTAVITQQEIRKAVDLAFDELKSAFQSEDARQVSNEAMVRHMQLLVHKHE